MPATHDDDYADIAREIDAPCVVCDAPAVSIEGLDAYCGDCDPSIPADVRALRSAGDPALRREAATFAVDGAIERLRQMAASARGEAA